MSDQPDTKTSTSQHSQQTDIRAPGGIQTHNPSKWTAADPLLTLRGHWDQPKFLNTVHIHAWLSASTDTYHFFAEQSIVFMYRMKFLQTCYLKCYK
jgi:hypothetical protein